MADVIRLSESEAISSKQKMADKAQTFLGGIKTLDNEVNSITRWYQGEAAVKFIDKYFSYVKPEIEKMVNECVEEYGALLMKVVNQQQEADRAAASMI